MSLNAAYIDTKIKATLSSTTYNMSRVSANGYSKNTISKYTYSLNNKGIS